MVNCKTHVIVGFHRLCVLYATEKPFKINAFHYDHRMNALQAARYRLPLESAVVYSQYTDYIRMRQLWSTLSLAPSLRSWSSAGNRYLPASGSIELVCQAVSASRLDRRAADCRVGSPGCGSGGSSGMGGGSGDDDLPSVREYQAKPRILSAGNTIRRPMVSPPPAMRRNTSRNSVFSKAGRLTGWCVMVGPSDCPCADTTFDGSVKSRERVCRLLCGAQHCRGDITVFARWLSADNARRPDWFRRF